MFKRFLHWLGERMVAGGATEIELGFRLMGEEVFTVADFDNEALPIYDYSDDKTAELNKQALFDLEDAARELLIHIDDCKCGRTIWAQAVADLIDDRPERQACP